MPLRIPPGRAGRLWLEHRLEVAHRGAGVLDQKRRALLRLERGLAAGLDAAKAQWEDAAKEAADWLARATTLSGRRHLKLALFHGGEPALVRVTWHNSLGVVYPACCDVELPEPLDVAALGGSAALATAADTHRRALEAAARYAVIKTAHARIARELAATALRARAIERRWIPQHEAALTGLRLALDETEREEATRTRWVTGHLEPSG
jgi:V/A-type H+/Na+-transporting ATPase subunit D